MRLNSNRHADVSGHEADVAGGAVGSEQASDKIDRHHRFLERNVSKGRAVSFKLHAGAANVAVKGSF
ncbi:hypothetical protein QBD00_003286 [Ochrobactrum sp. AN78]|nr:hypothetical protein [Ochrobactrum sp. AN78]